MSRRFHLAPTRVSHPGHVVTFLERDHVLDLVWAALRGESPESRSLLERFFYPERPALAPFFAGGTPPGTVIDAPATREDSNWQPDPDTTVLVIRRAEVPADLLRTLPRLTYIQKLGERADTIDLEHTARHDIAVELVARPSLEATADHTLLLMLALRRRLLTADTLTRRHTTVAAVSGAVAYNWTALEVANLHGSTVGIVGMGEVGLMVARRLRAFGARIKYTSPQALPTRAAQELDAERLELTDLLPISDVVSLHVPETAETRGMVNSSFLQKMKPGAVLVNAARGVLVDEPALHRALLSGHLAGAALDVHGSEPRHPEDPLLSAPNLLLTPHIGGGSHTAVIPEIETMLAGVRRAISRPPLAAAQPLDAHA